MSYDQRPTDSRGPDSAHADTPLFDPRHSPVFQRGYDPEADVAMVPAKSQGRASARRFPGREHVSGHDRAVDHPIAPPPIHAPAPEQQQPVDVTEEWTGDHPARNPFIVALWIIGIGLVVVAVAFQWWALSQNNSYSGTTMPIEMVLQQLSWSISAPMISTGMLTIVGLIVWKAVRWHERESMAPTRGLLVDTYE